MPNRILKESICTSDNLNDLSEEEENFFYRLLVCCDDFGRFDGRPLIIKSRCYPLRDKSTEIIKSHLLKLQAAKIITLYVVDDKEYIQMTTWDKHQQVRAKKSKYPAPADGLQSSDINCNQEIEDVPVIQSNPESNTNPTRMERREFSSLYFNTFGKQMSGMLNHDQEKICATYSPDKIRYAFKIAAENNAETIKYVEKVLQGDGRFKPRHKNEDDAAFDRLQEGLRGWK